MHGSFYARGDEMDNFSIVYKILRVLEKALDFEEFDVEMLSHEKYGISYRRWERIIIMLAKSGYIEGVMYNQCVTDYGPRIIKPINPIITLKGLEYLADNSMMKKAADLAKGIKEMIPGI